MQSLGCKVLCIMSFLVLWSICWSSSLDLFKNNPEYLSSGTALGFIPFMKFLLYSFALSIFFVLLHYSFKNIFFNFRLLDVVCFQYSQLFPDFLFSQPSYFSWFVSSIHSVVYSFPLFIISIAHFSMPNFILIYWRYILSVFVCLVFQFFSFLANSFISSMYFR